MITREAVRVLENSLTFTKQINRTVGYGEEELYTLWARSGTNLTLDQYRDWRRHGVRSRPLRPKMARYP
jgi:hypothetical protein